MYEDIPKSNPLKTILIVLVLVVVFAVIGYFIYRSFYPKRSNEASTSSPSPIISPSGGISSPTPSPTPSALASPLTSGTPDYKVPADETYTMSSVADTNGDTKDETLVITKQKDGKYHVYVLSSDGQSLFDSKDMPQKPVRISTQTYDSTKEVYLSWMMIFTENSGEFAFVHWNGSAYEIPESLGL